MTPDQFRARLASLGLTLSRFAELTGTHPVTCFGWGKRRGKRMQAFPAWVELVLSLMERERAA